jgi:four helix bundle protein
VPANWIEADEALSKKDFLMHLKICRKEAKESRLFLRLLEVAPAGNAERVALVGGFVFWDFSVVGKAP